MALTERKEARPTFPPPKRYPKASHNISRRRISPNALRVLARLHRAGFEACLVGGCVRDLLLGYEPKDFDVVTDARPEEVKRIFRNCRLIGRRFRLAHVIFGEEIIEVATFRALSSGITTEEGVILRDNLYGTMEEDAWRRDFTVNALYYDYRDQAVVDYVGGLEDLRQGILRVIGEPEVRYREDPVRMLRAIRFKAKLGLNFEPMTEAPIPEMAHLLELIPPARLYDETLKLFLSPHAVQTFELMRHYRLFEAMFPLTDAVLAEEEDHFPHTFLVKALENTEKRIIEEKPTTPYFLFAALLWEPVRARARQLEAQGENAIPALEQAASQVVQEQSWRVAIPKRIVLPMREVWTLQPRFLKRSGKRPFRLLSHPRFRAAYDFLQLRAEAGEVERKLADWWRDFVEASDKKRRQMVRKLQRQRSRG